MINDTLHSIENAAVDFIAVFAPWLGPIPSAYLVGAACIEYLQWHWTIAIIAALTVESIGVVSVVIALRLFEWNETKNKSDASAPFGLALVNVLFYFVVTIGLTVMLDVFPQLARYAPAVFPLLAAVGAVNIAIKNGQLRREFAKRRAKEERRRVPKTSPPARQVAKPQRQDTGNLSSDWRQLTTEQRKELAHIPRGEREDMLPELAPRTLRLWHQRLDEIAAQNGSYS